MTTTGAKMKRGRLPGLAAVMAAAIGPIIVPVLASVLTLATVLERPAAASGFLIYDLSGEALGRASAVSASVADATAVWFNPARLVFLGGSSVSVGGVFVTARSQLRPADGTPPTSSQRSNNLLPTFYAHVALGDRVALGMGGYTAFGIGIDWPPNWVGRENAIGASLETFALNPTVSVKLHPRVGLAAGFDAVRAAVDFRTGLPTLVGGDVRLGGGTWGYGWNAALQINAIPERLHVALTYRSRVRLDFTGGRADFQPEHIEFARELPDQGGSAQITLPDILTVGLMGRPRPDLTLGLDANWVRWSSYSMVDITFDTAPSKVLRPDGQDSLTLRAGVDWATHFCEGLHLRTGVIYDQGAVPASGLGPGLPDGNRIDFAAGVGFARGPFKIDLGYLLVLFLDANATGGIEGPVGTYSTSANLVGLTLSAATSLGL
jgi:long-chain fatty acid transport protein